jgi:intracellular septation protein A
MLLRGSSPLLVFYAFDWGWGLRPAIVASALWSMGEVVLRLVRKEKLDALFKFTAVTTFVFGALDLVITQPRFFSYEAVATNVVTGGFFASMAATDISPMLDQVHALRPDARGDLELPSRLRVAIGLCAAYCFVKAGIYAWMATAFSVERAMGLRVIVGNVSMVVFFAAVRFGIDPVLRLLQRAGYLLPMPEVKP